VRGAGCGCGRPWNFVRWDVMGMDGMRRGWRAGGAITCNYMQLHAITCDGWAVVLPLSGEVQPRWVVLAGLVCLCGRL
jgi:hypothetical protein